MIIYRGAGIGRRNPLAGVTGLDFPGNAGVTTTMRFGFVNPQNDGLAMNGTVGDGLTYIWRALYRAQNASPGYVTTFFYSDDNNWFEGGGDGRGYGMTGFPVDANFDTDFGATLDRHIHSLADGTDFPANQSNASDYEITYGQWYTQVARIVHTSSTVVTYDYYPDYESDPTLLLTKTYTAGARNGAPNDPVLMWGDAPHAQGQEVMSGVLRGFQIYDTLLSLADIDSELSTPGSVQTPWYLKLNPTPTDIADDSGNAHNPAWVGSERPTLWEG